MSRGGKWIKTIDIRGLTLDIPEGSETFEWVHDELPLDDYKNFPADVELNYFFLWCRGRIVGLQYIYQEGCRRCSGQENREFFLCA